MVPRALGKAVRPEGAPPVFAGGVGSGAGQPGPLPGWERVGGSPVGGLGSVGPEGWAAVGSSAHP